MIRPVTCVCMMLAAGSGLYLYQAKHRAQILEQDIAKVMRSAEANRDRMRVLRAEYQLLQDPTRMADLAAQHLALSKTDPKQFANWATLERNVPVVIAPPPAAIDPVPDGPETLVASLAGPAPPPAAAPARAEPLPSPAGTRPASGATPAAVTRAAPPATSAPGFIASAAPSRPPQNSAGTVVASAASGPRSALGMARGDAPAAQFAPSRNTTPLAEQVALTTQRRMPAMAQAPFGADPYARFNRGAPYETQPLAAGSALGMARTLNGAAPGGGVVATGNGG